MSPQAPWVSPGYPGIAWGHLENLRDLQRSSEIQVFRGCLKVTMAIGVFSDVPAHSSFVEMIVNEDPFELPYMSFLQVHMSQELTK